MTDDRPFVTINMAMTADGKTDTIARRGATISSSHDWARVDRLRAESDAVLVGVGKRPPLVRCPACGQPLHGAKIGEHSVIEYGEAQS